MRITKKMIEACRNKGACLEGLEWISVKPRTVEQLYKYRKCWFFWLLIILTPKARDAYDAAEKTARNAYDAAEKTAYDAYYTAVNKAYSAAEKTARNAYNAAVKTALIKALRETFA